MRIPSLFALLSGVFSMPPSKERSNLLHSLEHAPRRLRIRRWHLFHTTGKWIPSYRSEGGHDGRFTRSYERRNNAWARETKRLRNRARRDAAWIAKAQQEGESR